MAIKPILFNTEMVQAILAGRKAQTRRVVKPQPIIDEDGMWRWRSCQWMDGGIGFPASGVTDYAKYQVGGALWVRETWFKNYPHKYGKYFYRADGEEIDIPLITGGTSKWGKADGLKWRPSIHMPKEAARLFLRVTDVRVERLQDMTVDSAIKEGYPHETDFSWLPSAMAGLVFEWMIGAWNSTIKPADYATYGWNANPWVWVYEFERCARPDGWAGDAAHE